MVKYEIECPQHLLYTAFQPTPKLNDKLREQDMQGKTPNMAFSQPRNLEVLVSPFLGDLPLGLLGLRNRLTRLKLSLNDESSETIIQQVSLRFQES